MQFNTDLFDIRSNSLTVEEAGFSQLIDQMDEVFYEPGISIFESGSEVTNLYIQMDGRSIVQMPGLPEHSVCSCPIESPRVYGLMEALAGVPYGYSLISSCRSRFRMVSSSKMFLFLKENAASTYQLSRAVGRRYMEMVDVLKKT